MITYWRSLGLLDPLAEVEEGMESMGMGFENFDEGEEEGEEDDDQMDGEGAAAAGHAAAGP